MYRIGQSSDIHPLKKGRKLILGGVDIPFSMGLDGHSDADVLLHAIAEAIIGALGLHDLGHFFSDQDESIKGISSILILKKIQEVMDEHGYEINNVDSLIMIEQPKLKDYIFKMRENISKVLKTDIANINVKATCSEKLGFIGNQEGAMAQAVVLLRKKEKKS